MLLRPLLNALFAPVFRSKRNLRVLSSFFQIRCLQIFREIVDLEIVEKKKQVGYVALILGKLQQIIYKQSFGCFNGPTLTIFSFYFSFSFFFPIDFGMFIVARCRDLLYIVPG